MNGFTNSLLSVLLSWVRSLVGNLWSFAGSDGGGSFYNFMAAHWLTVVVVLCAGGFVVDRLIYLIRWRPYYVWGSKLRRLLGARHREAQAPPEPAYVPPQDSEEPPTQTYAPAGFAHPAAQEPGDELNLGDDWEAWEQEEEAVPPSPNAAFAKRLYDVQAGFAPPMTPQELYAPPASDPAYAPVHPGLDDETFRQNFGLNEAEDEEALYPGAAEFQPFTARETAVTQEPGVLRRLARKARSLVSVDDDEHRPEDLHPTVDVSKAFHDPVYPQPKDLER